MAEQTEDRRLFREATDLAIRLQNDPANPVPVRMMRVWASRSPAHAAVWARVAEIHGMTGKILAEERRAQSGGRLSRRSFMIGGAVGLGGMGAGSMVLPDVLTRMRADHLTETAEIRRIDLSDGTIMTLGPESAVVLAYSDTHRGVELLAGMANFAVASDALRPFSVRSGSVTATALGTQFDVSTDAGFISVSVEHGEVETSAPDSDFREDERLAAGNWITFDPTAGHVVRGTREASEFGAWRSGRIVADQETVAAMVAKISRWIPGQVFIADPSLGSRVVSGVFDLSDPVRALEAVARPFGAKVRGIGSVVTVIYTV